MKKIILAFLLFLSAEISAQTKITKFQVEGNCGMCKKNIEQAAVDAGAQAATANGELVSAHVIPRPEKDVLEFFLGK